MALAFLTRPQRATRGPPRSRAMHVLACRGALTAQGSGRTRDSARRDVAFRFHNNVGTLNGLISQLHTSPTSAPVNASPLALRPDTHDSGNSVVRYTFTI